MTTDTATALTDEDVARFTDQGYLVFPAHVPADEVAELCAATDDVEARKGELAGAYEQPRLRALIEREETLRLLDRLFPAPYAFHHLHIARQAAGTPGVAWHHDYEQRPQSNRKHLMVHVFYYLHGLTGEIGDLVVLPGSHRSIMKTDAFWFLGEQPLPTEVVVDDVPPGTMVIVHSGLLHSRRAQPGGESHLRYFLDASYCETGVRWPSYGPAYASMLATLRSTQRDRELRPQLFSDEHFFDSWTAHQHEQGLVGSVVTQLPDWSGA
jgi:hypothetical protein